MAGGLRRGIATYRCPTDGPQAEPISSRARVYQQGRIRPRVRTTSGHWWWGPTPLARSRSGTAKDAPSVCREATWTALHAKCRNDAGKEHAQRRMSKSDKVIEPQKV
jgi:hypothetical protein